MEVTRQLRVDRVTKTGLAPLMLTCWWDNQRLRLMPGEKCLPNPLQHLFDYLLTPSYFSMYENQPNG